METPRAVRFGILGCAGIARKNIRAMHMVEGVTAYAIGSRSLENATKYAAEVQMTDGCKIYGSYQEVLDDEDVDAVYIPLPTGLHVEWCRKAAEKKKHILLEKPPALTVSDMDLILEACSSNGVQLMDGTMWMHNPRTEKLHDIVSDSNKLGTHRMTNVSFDFCGDDNFLKNDIRVKPGLDGLGALGDLGWYCIRASLWARGFELPQSVTALPSPVKNEGGVLLSCGAQLKWKGGETAVFDCSFISHFRQTVSVAGTKAVVLWEDFCIPDKETVSIYRVSTCGGVDNNATQVTTQHEVVEVPMPMPQEAFMIVTMAKIVRGLMDGSGALDPHWPKIARLTQVVVNAVLESVDKGCTTVTLA